MTDEDEDAVDKLEAQIAAGARRPEALAAGLVDFGKRAGSALVAAVAEQLVPGSGVAAGMAASATVAGVDALRRNLAAQTERDAVRALAERAPEIDAKHADLVRAGYGSPADVRAIVEAYIIAWSAQADGRVRELIENAAVSGFDPRKYDQGVTKRILRILGELEYGDVMLLRELQREATQNSARPPRMWDGPTTMRDEHATQLLSHRLIAKLPLTDMNGEPVMNMHTARPTELGVRLLKHIEREAAASALRDLDAALERGGARKSNR